MSTLFGKLIWLPLPICTFAADMEDKYIPTASHPLAHIQELNSKR
jgi:hypothetical protein